jgi:hypothetical protein
VTNEKRAAVGDSDPLKTSETEKFFSTSKIAKQAPPRTALAAAYHAAVERRAVPR